MTLNLGMVGCGRISHAHGIAARRIGRETVRFVACCDVKEDNARAFADAYGCDTVYTDPAKMLREEKLDALVLATWPAQHLEQIRQAAEAGIKYILCEKSLATNGADAFEIWKIAKEHGVVVVEGFMYLHHPLIKKVDEIVAQRDTGAVDWVRSCSSYHFPEIASADDQTRSWRFRKETGGGVPWDLACYTLNAVTRYAAQLPACVCATGSRSENYGTINRLFGTITYEGGRFGVIESSAGATFNQALEIHTVNRTIHVETVFTPPGDTVVREMTTLKPSHIRVDEHRVESPIPLQDDLPSFYCYQAQLEDFVEVVRNGATPQPALSHSVVNVMTIEALLQSVESRNTVYLDIPSEIRHAWLNSL
jgi:predicted dehydrogenase